ncbi:hypothetical protein [Alienimonas chondri]|uniref:Uncharacterized protein n=1 Tax=Alienimonas chondri TaxID=2681879 RepID=A0ABX1VHZ9_9PLAN|nr:hypothetical protein [Alienimonas chondri]NNJ26918.1 hypothetical protein [Alienimonas chondri]
MSAPNLTAATQGRGFGSKARPADGRKTRLGRSALILIALAAASFGSVGCQSVPIAHVDGSTARLVAAVDAKRAGHDVAYAPATPERTIILAGAR